MINFYDHIILQEASGYPFISKSQGKEVIYKFYDDSSPMNRYQIFFTIWRNFKTRDGTIINLALIEMEAGGAYVYNKPDAVNNPTKVLNTRKNVIADFITEYPDIDRIISVPIDERKYKLWDHIFKSLGYKTTRTDKILTAHIKSND